MRGNILIFGYGSLISARVGLGHRNLRFPARESQFHECALSDYARSFNAVYRGWSVWEDEWFEVQSRFFGITKTAGARTNGVVFPLDERDIGPFINSEGGDKVYDFVDVRDLIVDLPIDLAPEIKVYACVTKRPSFDEIVSASYIERCTRALAFRSEAFRQEFNDIYAYPGAPAPKAAHLTST